MVKMTESNISKCEGPFSTGLFIPSDKQSLFIVAFENILISTYNLVPFFELPTKKKSCEVKFHYLGNKSFKPGSFVSDFAKALDFVKANMNVLETKKLRRRGKNSKSLQRSPPVIDLVGESEQNVDLTDGDQGDPEIIVLEDSIIHSNRETRPRSTRSSIVDLTDINESSQNSRKRKGSENDITILNVKRFKSQKSPNRSTANSSITTISCLNMLNTSKTSKKKRKKKKSNIGSPLTRTINNSSANTESFIPLSSTKNLPKKKKKLKDISNVPESSSCKSPNSAPQSDLSENTQKYYENMLKVVSKGGKQKSETLTSMSYNFKDSLASSANTRKKSPLIMHLENNKKRKVFTPQNEQRNTGNHQNKFLPRLPNLMNSPRRSRRISQLGINTSKRKIGETNSFNPNPFEVDLDGLRPIVIDGSNVAIGHGRGKFSTKGLKICVDYFATRGHTTIKLFLPQFRQQEFSAELLEALKIKCDVVFTPSQCINGQRRTPYDDRFIVQYATEFGGVIVSTDNYRDLAKENPRWQQTIEKRLLMFTWVDDFLMFPVDPLGRRGPTLEEFLRF